LLSGARRWKFEGSLVRGLVRAGKAEQAVKEAEALTKSGHLDPLLLVLAHAAQGDVQKTIAAAEKLRDGLARQRCYQDEDLSPLLRREAFAAFRTRFPGATKSATGPR